MTGIALRRWLFAATLVAAFLSCAAGEAARVVEVIDGDTLRVETRQGRRTVRLLGIDTPERGRDDRVAEFLAEEAWIFAKRLAAGNRVTLEVDPQADTVDRYGRALRYVFLPDGRMLNAVLLSEGYACAYTRFPFSRIEEFRRLEAEAREAGRGLWDPEVLPELTAEEAGELVGRTARICDRVASIHYASTADGRPTFINLGRPYPEQPLTLVIWGSDRERFGKPEQRYADRRICVTGKIRSFKGRAELTVTDPSQLTIVDPAKP